MLLQLLNLQLQEVLRLAHFLNGVLKTLFLSGYFFQFCLARLKLFLGFSYGFQQFLFGVFPQLQLLLERICSIIRSSRLRFVVLESVKHLPIGLPLNLQLFESTSELFNVTFKLGNPF